MPHQRNGDNRHLSAGNRCGHEPVNPKWFVPPSTHKTRPKILVRLGRAIESYYFSPREIIPALNFVNGSSRIQRSERREACLKLLGAIVHYTDLSSLEVGVPQSDGTIGAMTIARMAALTQMEQRRTERAMHDLKKAGIITIQRLSKHVDGLGYRGLAAIKTLSSHVFTLFGLGRWLVHEQRRASARKERRGLKSSQKGGVQCRMVVDALLNLTGSVNSQNTRDRTQRANLEFLKIRDLLGVPISA